MKKKLVWQERKRLWCGLPWTFTKYGMSEDRLFVQSGLFSVKEYEVRLYRILNINVKRSFLQRLFGLGTIHIDSNDTDLGCFDLKNIRRSTEVKEMLSDAVESERQRNRVSSREYMMHYEDEDHDGIPDAYDDDFTGHHH